MRGQKSNAEPEAKALVSWPGRGRAVHRRAGGRRAGAGGLFKGGAVVEADAG